MRVAVLGTGDVGRALADRLDGLGHQVVLGTRDPAAARAQDAGEAASLVAWLDAHPDVELRAFGRAAQGAELVVNATAGVATLEVLAAIDEDDLGGVVLLDVANPLDLSGGFPPRLSVVGDDSLAEQVQRAAPRARVVKGLNTVSHEVMVDPGQLEGRHEVFIAGDDGAAKQHVTDLLVTFGWPPECIVDLGPLRSARATEMYLPLWVSLMQALGTTRFNVHLVREGG